MNTRFNNIRLMKIGFTVLTLVIIYRFLTFLKFNDGRFRRHNRRFGNQPRLQLKISDSSSWIITQYSTCCNSSVFRDWKVLIANNTGVFVSTSRNHCSTRRVELQVEPNAAYYRMSSPHIKSKINAYLYAVKNGATEIYVGAASPGNIEQLKIVEYVNNDNNKTLLSNMHSDRTRRHLDPVDHFWCNQTPAGRCSGPSNNYFTLCDVSLQPAFVKLVSNPRVLRKSPKVYDRGRNLGLNRGSPGLLSDDETLYAFIMENILFVRNTLWLASPMFDPVEQVYESTLWSYLIQILLGEVESHGVFSAGFSVADDNGAFNFNKMSIDALVRIMDIPCENLTIQECAFDVIDLFIEYGLCDTTFKQTFADWLVDLSHVGYTISTIPLKRDISCDNAPYLIAPFQPISEEPKPLMYANIGRSNEIISTTCGLGHVSDFKQNSLRYVRSQFDDILLVIWFNHVKHINAIKYLETVYRPTFENILYCGPEMPTQLLLQKYDISFIQRDPDWYETGDMTYGCLTKAIRLQYTGIRDYLMISDDVMMNFWQLNKLPRNKLWFQHEVIDGVCGRYIDILSGKECMRQNCNKEKKLNAFKALDGTCFDCTLDSRWIPLNSYRKNVIRLLNHMSTSSNTLLHSCYEYNIRQNGAYNIINARMASDIFYIPASLAQQFSSLSSHFIKFGIHLEIAVPMIGACLSNGAFVHILSGTGFYGRDRNKPWLHYNIHDAYIHPSKLGLVSYDKQFKYYFCNMVLTNISFHVNSLITIQS